MFTAINYALAKRRWVKAGEDITLLGKGNRNLFINGSFDDFNVGDSYDSHKSNISELIISDEFAKYGSKSLKVVPSSLTNTLVRIFSDGEESFIKLEEGQTATGSMWIYPLESTSIRIGINEAGQTGTIIWENVTGGKWNHIKVSHTRTNSKSDYWLFIQHFKTTVYVDGVKVEYGSESTGFTPSPEEIYANDLVSDMSESAYHSNDTELELNKIRNAVVALGGSV